MDITAKLLQHLIVNFECEQASTLSNRESRTIQLPLNTKVVNDICILRGGFALFASQGKRLSLFRVVLNIEMVVPYILLFFKRNTYPCFSFDSSIN